MSSKKKGKFKLPLNQYLDVDGKNWWHWQKRYSIFRHEDIGLPQPQYKIKKKKISRSINVCKVQLDHFETSFHIEL